MVNQRNQLREGTVIESEHKGTVKFIDKYVKKYGKLPPSNKIYKNIAKEHLKERKNYYELLKKYGL